MSNARGGLQTFSAAGANFSGLTHAGAVELLAGLAAGDDTRAARQACRALAAVLSHGLNGIAQTVSAATPAAPEVTLPAVLLLHMGQQGPIAGDDALRTEASAVLCEVCICSNCFDMLKDAASWKNLMKKWGAHTAAVR